ncbi:MAG: bacteriohemerythrin [Magnetovibrionaceae bacterium]
MTSLPNVSSTGLIAVDKQHREMLHLVTDFVTAEKTTASYPFLISALDRIIDTTLEHFEEEERYMQNIGFPLLEGHARAHQELRNQVGEFRGNIAPDMTVTDWDQSVHFIWHWVHGHIDHYDRALHLYIEGDLESLGLMDRNEPNA